MERLIEFAYTASISVGEKCVIHVMNGAVMYQIDSVVKACCDFLVQQLDPSNAIGIANFAEQIGCTELHQKAREYIYLNFSQVRLQLGFEFKKKKIKKRLWVTPSLCAYVPARCTILLSFCRLAALYYVRPCVVIFY